MICFPNAKINIGLNIVKKRHDGFHDLKSVFYPVPLKDALEIIPSAKFKFSQTGQKLDCKAEDNIVVKAFRLFQKKYTIDNVHIHLHKHIPFGAGLGGGSSDAAFLIIMLNDFYKLNLKIQELVEFVKPLGSDCAFFIENKPVFATKKGDEFEFIDLNLKGYHLVLVFPEIHINTAEAYKNTPPFPSTFNKGTIKLDIKEWKNNIKNDFEEFAIKKYPEIMSVKSVLYKQGALYASMTGSGSAVYGIFEEKPLIKNFKNNYFVFQCQL